MCSHDLFLAHMHREGRSGVSLSSYKGTNPILGTPTLLISSNLITSCRPNLLIPSHGVGGCKSLTYECGRNTRICQTPWLQDGRELGLGSGLALLSLTVPSTQEDGGFEALLDSFPLQKSGVY